MLCNTHILTEVRFNGKVNGIYTGYVETDPSGKVAAIYDADGRDISQGPDLAWEVVEHLGEFEPHDVEERERLMVETPRHSLRRSLRADGDPCPQCGERRYGGNHVLCVGDGKDYSGM